MKKLTLEFSDQIHEKKYCQQLSQNNSSTVQQNMLILLMIAIISAIYYGIINETSSFFINLAFCFMFALLLMLVKRNYKLFEYLVLWVQLGSLSIFPFYQLQAYKIIDTFLKIDPETNQYIAGQLILIFCQQFSIGQTFKFKLVAYIYSIIAPIISILITKQNLSIAQITFVLISIQHLHCVYQNEKMLREAFTSSISQQNLIDGLNNTVGLSVIVFRYEDRQQKLELIKVNQFASQLICVKDQTSFITFLRNGKILDSPKDSNQFQQPKQTNWLNKNKKKSLENQLYFELVDSQQQSSPIMFVEYESMIYRVRLITFSFSFRQKDSVYNLIVEKFQEKNQSLVNSQKKQITNLKMMIGSLQKQFEQSIIPVTYIIKNLMLRDQFVRRIDLRNDLRITLKLLYIPIVQYLNVQIHLRQRKEEITTFILPNLMNSIYYLNKLINPKIILTLKYNNNSQENSFKQCRMLLILAITNILSLIHGKCQKNQMLNVKIVLGQNCYQGNKIRIKIRTLVELNEPSRSINFSPERSINLSPKTLTKQSNPIWLSNCSKIITKIGPTSELRIQQIQDLWKYTFMIYSDLTLIPASFIKKS